MRPPLLLALTLILTLGPGCRHARHGANAHVELRPLLKGASAGEGVRRPEVVRSYSVGRQVDPEDPDLMHEAHPVFRVESGQAWDLRPGSRHPSTPPLQDAAYAPPPLNDEILAELHRQQDATERVMWEATQLAKSYDELRSVLADMALVAREHATFRVRLQDSAARQARLEEALKAITGTGSPVQFEVPPTAP